MKIYIINDYLFDNTDKPFNEMTDKEVVNLCETCDPYQDNHDEFDSIEKLQEAWNAGEILWPESSYMRVVKP